MAKTKKHEKNEKKNWIKKRKGFEKKLLWTLISKVNFQGKGRKHCQKDTKTTKSEKGSRKVPFDNFNGQFSRQRKEK